MSHRRYADLVLLHIEEGSGERDRYNTATMFSRAAEEGLVDPHRSFHVGPRGPAYIAGCVDTDLGGASAREGLGLLKGLAGLRFVGFEVNTVSPPASRRT